MRNKTTGHIDSFFRAALFALVVLVGPLTAGASELALTTSNDIISGEDDLYTAELGARVAWSEGRALLLGERIFTDRERGIRFDESYAAIRATLPPVAGWDVEIGAGALHVGEGLAGESLQNAVHRVVGSDRVDLEYPDRGRWFPTVSLAVGRTFLANPRAAIGGRGEIDAVPGFRTLVLGEVLAERTVGRQLAVRVGLGVLGAHAESRWLGDRLREIEPTVRLGVQLGRVAVEWGHNLYGTATDHATIAYHMGIGRGGRE